MAMVAVHVWGWTLEGCSASSVFASCHDDDVMLLLVENLDRHFD